MWKWQLLWGALSFFCSIYVYCKPRINFIPNKQRNPAQNLKLPLDSKGQNTAINVKGVVCWIGAVGWRPNGSLYKREATRQIEIIVTPYRLGGNVVVLAHALGCALVWDHLNGSPSALSVVVPQDATATFPNNFFIKCIAFKNTEAEQTRECFPTPRGVTWQSVG